MSNFPETYGSLQIKVDLNNTNPHGRVTDQAVPSALFISVSGPKDLAMERIELVESEGEYVSSPFALPVGVYHFLVVDENKQNINLTKEAYIELWNKAHPDDLVTL